MRIRNLLTATALGTALAFGGLAVTAPAALASTVEGKISAIAADTHTVTINKKVYRLNDGAKVLVGGKPGSFGSLKSGMNCKATLASTSIASALTCTNKK